MAESAAPAMTVSTVGRPAAVRLVWEQVRYADREFWRTPISAFFTLVFPLVCLVVIAAIFGNPVVDEATGLHLAQYLTPVFAVFGACMASYMSMAIAVAYARSSGVLKRLRGTPLRPSHYVAGRLGSALWLSGIAMLLMVAAGVLIYDVTLIRANLPALVLTFVVGTACFSALGVAVASVAPTPTAATAFANTSLILLSFISGIFGGGQLPAWLDWVASVFPLKPYAQAFSAGFDPAVDASRPDWSALAVMAAWAVVGMVVIVRSFGFEPRSGRVVLPARRSGAAPVEGTDLTEPVGAVDRSAPVGVAEHSAPTELVTDVPVHSPGPPSGPRLLWIQTRYALTQIRRDTLAVFFAVFFPVLMLLFFTAQSPQGAQWDGLPMAQYLAAALAVYGVATSGILTLPGSIADHRVQGTLRRLRGSPAPPWSYIAGRVLATVALGLLTAALSFVVAILVYSATLPPSTWLATLGSYILIIACFSACGLALVSLVDRPQAVTAAALSLLLPLSFISGVFIQVEQMPTLLEVISWIFPLRHAVAVAVTSSSGMALNSMFWVHVGVLLAWTAATALVAWRYFHWEPRSAGG